MKEIPHNLLKSAIYRELNESRGPGKRECDRLKARELDIWKTVFTVSESVLFAALYDFIEVPEET